MGSRLRFDGAGVGDTWAPPEKLKILESEVGVSSVSSSLDATDEAPDEDELLELLSQSLSSLPKLSSGAAEAILFRARAAAAF